MIPVLFKIGPLTVHAYGVLIAFGIFLAMRYVLAHARRQNIPENVVLDVVLYAVISGIVGARLTYVIFNRSYYFGRPFEIFYIWEGGLVFYGGFTLAAIVVWYYIRRHPSPRFWQLADMVAPALVLGHMFGRLGCFSAGCCYGAPSSVPWAVTFSNALALAPIGIALHPTQIYEAIANAGIFLFLDRYNHRPHAEGRAFGWYLLLYAAMRFVIEFFRGDERGAFIAGCSPSQLTAIVMAAAALIILRKLKK